MSPNFRVKCQHERALSSVSAESRGMSDHLMKDISSEIQWKQPNNGNFRLRQWNERQKMLSMTDYFSIWGQLKMENIEQ